MTTVSMLCKFRKTLVNELTYLQNGNRVTDVENKFMVPTGLVAGR